MHFEAVTFNMPKIMCNVSFLFVSKFLLLKEMTWAIYIDFFFEMC